MAMTVAFTVVVGSFGDIIEKVHDNFQSKITSPLCILGCDFCTHIVSSSEVWCRRRCAVFSSHLPEI